MGITKKQKLQVIKEMLQTNDKWAVRALVRVYENQTRDEQVHGHTEELNGVGFSGIDSEILSSFATSINKGRRGLSVKQMALLHKLIGKYAGQILPLCEANPDWWNKFLSIKVK